MRDLAGVEVLLALAGRDGVLAKLSSPSEGQRWRRGTSSVAELWKLSDRIRDCTVAPSDPADKESQRGRHNFFVGSLAGPVQDLYDSLARKEPKMQSRDSLRAKYVELYRVLQRAEEITPILSEIAPCLVGTAHGNLDLTNIILDVLESAARQW